MLAGKPAWPSVEGEERSWLAHYFRERDTVALNGIGEDDLAALLGLCLDDVRLPLAHLEGVGHPNRFRESMWELGLSDFLDDDDRQILYT